jgi:hypothetical protein
MSPRESLLRFEAGSDTSADRTLTVQQRDSSVQNNQSRERSRGRRTERRKTASC